MVAPADWHLPDPSNVEDYVRRCLTPEFVEENETRTFRSDPVFASVLTPLNAGQYAKAIEAAELLLPRFPDLDIVYHWLGSAHRSTQQLARSREILSEGIWKAKRKWNLLTDMGEIEWKSGDIHAAVYWWSQAFHCLLLKPVNYNAYLLLASVAAGLGFHDLMRALYARADSVSGTPIRLVPQEKNALEALVRNNKTEALQKTLRGLQSKCSFSNGAIAWRRKGDAALREYKGEAEALKCFDKALEINPTDAGAWSGKGIALDQLGRREEAMKCYDKALEINPGAAYVWSNKIGVLTYLKKFEEAIVCLDKLLEIEPTPSHWSGKGDTLHTLGRDAEAIVCYDRALELQPSSPWSWSHKGAALGALGRFEEAIKCFDKALEIRPRYAEAWSNKGDALNALERYADAIKCHDKALEIDPRLDSALKGRTVAAQRLGK
jgi:tetratricopeptide (TPR) repeat protein